MADEEKAQEPTVITPACGGKRQAKLLRERREKEATHVQSPRTSHR